GGCAVRRGHRHLCAGGDSPAADRPVEGRRPDGDSGGRPLQSDGLPGDEKEWKAHEEGASPNALRPDDRPRPARGRRETKGKAVTTRARTLAAVALLVAFAGASGVF